MTFIVEILPFRLGSSPRRAFRDAVLIEAALIHETCRLVETRALILGHLSEKTAA
jgi:hypothetical protein